MHIMGKKFNSLLDAAALGDQIRQARLERGLSLVELGRAVSVDHSQISRYERGQMSSVAKNLQIICTFLQIDADPGQYAVASTSLGQKVDELLRFAPGYEPAVAKLVEALEGLLATARRDAQVADLEIPPVE